MSSSLDAEMPAFCKHRHVAAYCIRTVRRAHWPCPRKPSIARGCEDCDGLGIPPIHIISAQICERFEKRCDTFKHTPVGPMSRRSACNWSETLISALRLNNRNADILCDAALGRLCCKARQPRTPVCRCRRTLIHRTPSSSLSGLQ